MENILKILLGVSALLVASSVSANGHNSSAGSAVIVGYTSGTYFRQDVILMNEDCQKTFGNGARVANTIDLINTIKQGLFRAPTEPQVRILMSSPIAIGPTGPARLLYDVPTGYSIENDNTNELSFTPAGSFVSSANSLKSVACAK